MILATSSRSSTKHWNSPTTTASRSASASRRSTAVSRLRHLLPARTFRWRAHRERQTDLSRQRDAAADAQCAEYRARSRYGISAGDRTDAWYPRQQDSAPARRLIERTSRLRLRRLALGDDCRPLVGQGDGYDRGKGQAYCGEYAGNRRSRYRLSQR